jgi:hypothetical protein
VAILVDVVEGWTAAIDMQLNADGVAVNLTGATVELILRGVDGARVGSSGNLSIINSTGGQVRYLPDVGDLVARRSPYRARFKVTDAAAKIAFYPSGESDSWVVRSA